MNSTYRLTALLTGAVVTVVQPFYTAKAVSAASVGQVAKEVTVFIQGVNNPDSFGSGVIIGHSGKTYSVLTAAHVVANADQYTIQTNDGVGYTLKSAQRLPKVDLAVVQFDSTSTYTTAQLGNSTQVDLTTPVYVAGYPKPGQNITVPVLTITSGEIAQVLPQGSAKDGYALSYSNSTRAGMSGGPVFNGAGEVIAIHGRKEGEIGGGATNGAWLNLGIPINSYKDFSSGSVVIARVPDVAQQRQAQEQAQRQAQEQAQRQAQEQAQRQAQEQAQRQAQEQAQRQAQEQAQRQAQEQAQRQAQEQAQRQAQEQAQRQAQEQAQRQAQEQAQRQAQEQAQKTIPAAGNLLASVSPLDVFQSESATAPASKQVCEDIRINMIVTKRCRQESVAPSPKNTPETYVIRGNSSAGIGSYKIAVESYTNAIQENPTLAAAFFNRGLAYYKLDQKDNAVSDFSKAADLFRSQGDSQKFQQTQEIIQSITQTRS